MYESSQPMPPHEFQASFFSMLFIVVFLFAATRLYAAMSVIYLADSCRCLVACGGDITVDIKGPLTIVCGLLMVTAPFDAISMNADPSSVRSCAVVVLMPPIFFACDCGPGITNASE